ncbi:MAG TPA: hypothetical protein VKK79_09555 [Candidatus Lokiarchaeia archaeon]|nr:hypothetical protein [Candidatus Lokiarchaeia archaeon]
MRKEKNDQVKADIAQKDKGKTEIRDSFKQEKRFDITQDIERESGAAGKDAVSGTSDNPAAQKNALSPLFAANAAVEEAKAAYFAAKAEKKDAESSLRAAIAVYKSAKNTKAMEAKIASTLGKKALPDYSGVEANEGEAKRAARATHKEKVAAVRKKLASWQATYHATHKAMQVYARSHLNRPTTRLILILYPLLIEIFLAVLGSFIIPNLFTSVTGIISFILGSVVFIFAGLFYITLMRVVQAQDALWRNIKRGTISSPIAPKPGHANEESI